jgi:hypothetical protein
VHPAGRRGAPRVWASHLVPATAPQMETSDLALMFGVSQPESSNGSTLTRVRSAASRKAARSRPRWSRRTNCRRARTSCGIANAWIVILGGFLDKSDVPDSSDGHRVAPLLQSVGRNPGGGSWRNQATYSSIPSRGSGWSGERSPGTPRESFCKGIFTWRRVGLLLPNTCIPSRRSASRSWRGCSA